MKNKALKHFKELPENFSKWLSLFPGLPSSYNLATVTDIYKKNLDKQVGFIYKKFSTKSTNIDFSNHWYDDKNYISQIRMEIVSEGDPKFFFGSKKEYKDLLSNLLNDSKAIYYFNEFYQFGKVYNFADDSIANPVDII
jgi:hypothetical protein